MRLRTVARSQSTNIHNGNMPHESSKDPNDKLPQHIVLTLPHPHRISFSVMCGMLAWCRCGKRCVERCGSGARSRDRGQRAPVVYLRTAQESVEKGSRPCPTTSVYVYQV